MENSLIFWNICNQNSQSEGGGIYGETIDRLYARNNSFTKNKAVYKGGGCSLKNIRILDNKDNYFEENMVYLDEGLNVFEKNNNYRLSFGGGIYLYNEINGTQINLTGNIYKGNKGSSGGGIYIQV